MQVEKHKVLLSEFGERADIGELTGIEIVSGVYEKDYLLVERVMVLEDT